MAEFADANTASTEPTQNGTDNSTSYVPETEQPAAEDESDEDYDPSSLMPDFPSQDIAGQSSGLQDDPHSSSRSASTKPVAMPVKPRTMGGFAVDSSDEEETPVAQDSDGHLNVAQAELKTAETLSDPPNNATPVPDVPIENTAQDQDATGVASPISVPLAVPQIVTALSDSDLARPIPDPSPSLQTSLQNGAVHAAVPAPTSAVVGLLPKARLPSDTIGMLEDRITDDPRGDLEAWQDLISEYRKRNKVEEARKTYDRFFEVFPRAADEWVSYAKMETDADAKAQVESIFHRSLQQAPNVKLWITYLDYVRRINNVSTDPTGNARKTILQTFDFVAKSIGIDPSAGYLWQEYISFVKSGPGNLGGTGWQDLQKTDEVRKVYQRAAVIPTRASTAIWQDYQKFENEINKATARKFLQEISPSFVTARSSAIHLASLSKDLIRTTLPKLPPAANHDGHAEYMEQVRIWQSWINWEKSDPLNVKEDDVATYQARVVYVFKQALMALQFWPEMWFEAAEFCFENGLNDEATTFLRNGAAANPESLLLAFKLADRVESDTASQTTSSDEALKARGDKIRVHFDHALEALYRLLSRIELREKQTVARLTQEHQAASLEQHYVGILRKGDDDDNEEDQEDPQVTKQKAFDEKVKAIKDASLAEKAQIKSLITSAWIGLMRAMRRVQGKGSTNKDVMVGGFRRVFQEARNKGKITSKIYVESALIEHYCYKDVAAMKIFDRGMRLNPDDEQLALEYIKLLLAINDASNARQVFETTVSKLVAKPENLDKAKPLFRLMHEYDSQFGNLPQIQAREKRMAELWPQDPKLELFTQRFRTSNSDPAAFMPVISPAVQLKPLSRAHLSVEEPSSLANSPRTAHLNYGAVGSPKRAFNHDESDNDLLPPRKLMRGESPLKGAAGRRLDASRRHGHTASIGSLPTLPAQLHALFSALPNATTFIEHTNGQIRFNVPRMVQILREVDLTRANTVPLTGR